MYIYKITNLINGKIYVGLSTKTVEESINYYGSGRLINEAIDKYGKENFCKEILEDNIKDLELLKNREIYWIDSLKSHVHFDNYNLTLGGDGSLGLSPSAEWRKKISDGIKNSPKYSASKEIMSEKSKERWKDHAYKAKMSEMRMGHPAYPNQQEAASKIWKGKKLPKEVVEKIRMANTGRRFSDEVNKSKGRPGRIISEEQKQAVSKALKGKKKSPEHIKKMSGCQIGKRYSDVVNKSKGRPGRKWYYNPITKECTMDYECPPGFIKGRGINKNKP